MKKTLIAVMALLVAFAFVSCGETEKTRTELLTQSKGWSLTAATSDPAYELEIGAPITNLFDGFIADCELDDIIYFKTNNSEILDFGKDGKTYPCDEAQTTKEKSLGNWAFANGEKNLKFYFPAYEELLEAVILTLNENTLKLSVKIAEDDGIVASPLYRGKRGNKTVRDYVFTLTYSIK